MINKSGFSLLKDRDLEELFDFIDRDRSSKISLNEFRYFFYEREALEQEVADGVGLTKTFDHELEELFGLIDQNKNGTIDVNEFVTCLHLLRYSINPEVIKNEFRNFDGNNDGKIDISEFKQLMRKKLRKDFLKAHTQIPKIRKVFRQIHPRNEDLFTYP